MEAIRTLTLTKNLKLFSKIFFLISLSFLILHQKSQACSDITYSDKVKKVCRYHWSEKGEKRMTELTLYKKGCEKMEGSEPEDCFFVKTCNTHFTSGPIFKDPKWLNAHCEFRNPELRIVLGSPDEFPPSPVVAKLICRGSKVVSVEMTAPNKKAINCFLD